MPRLFFASEILSKSKLSRIAGVRVAGARRRSPERSRRSFFLREGNGRGDWIRTSDPLRPRQVRYQAALRPDNTIIAEPFAEPVFAVWSPPLPLITVFLQKCGYNLRLAICHLRFMPSWRT